MIELVPKPTEKAPSWQNILFYFALILFLSGLICYFVLDYYQSKTREEISVIEQRLNDGEIVKEIKSLEDFVLRYKGKIEKFSYLINGHERTSNIFSFLESITHPEVKWTDFVLSSETQSVELNGETENFTTLEQQYLIMKKENLIQGLTLSGISKKDEKIRFSIKFSFNPQILK